MSKGIIVVSAPRSGSTLLQRILMSSPRISFSGETYGLLDDLYKTYCKSCEFKKKRKILPPDLDKRIELSKHPAWINMTDDGEWKRSFYYLLRGWSGYNPKIHDFWGWKEVRLVKDGDTGVLDWLTSISDDLTIVILKRDFGDVLKSMLAKGDSWYGDYGKNDAKLESALRKQYNALSRFSENSFKNTYTIHYEDILRDDFHEYIFETVGIPVSHEAWKKEIKRKI